jgi:hypothetical protein
MSGLQSLLMWMQESDASQSQSLSEDKPDEGAPGGMQLPYSASIPQGGEAQADSSRITEEEQTMSRRKQLFLRHLAQAGSLDKIRPETHPRMSVADRIMVMSATGRDPAGSITKGISARKERLWLSWLQDRKKTVRR